MAVYYTSPESFIISYCFSSVKQLWGLLLNFDWLVQTFEPLIVIYGRGNFVYHHWGRTSGERWIDYNNIFVSEVPTLLREGNLL